MAKKPKNNNDITVACYRAKKMIERISLNETFGTSHEETLKQYDREQDKTLYRSLLSYVKED